MSDNIDIVVREQGTKQAADGLRSIAASSIKAADNVNRLNKELRGLKVGSAVVNDMQKMLTMANKIISANTGLAASQVKLASAAARLAEADQRVALARQRVATETQKTNKFMADAEAALNRAVLASTKSAVADQQLAAGKIKVQQETAKLAGIQSRAAADAQRLAEATSKAAAAAQRLTTEQQRTITAMNQAAAAQTAAITATTNGATALARLATEQQRTATAATAAQTAQQNLATATSKAATAATNAQTATQRLAAEQQRVKVAAANAAAASDRAALAALRLSEAQKRAATGSRSSANAMADFAKQAAAVTGITMSIQAVGGMADAYTNMQNKLVNLAPEMRSVNKLHNEMFEIANKTRQPVAAVTTAFQRFDMAMIDMGGSQKETLRMTETINKAIVVSGATATESAAGLLQLAQAFGSGRLQGDEFRSIMENLPVVADMIAKSMGKTRSELKKLSSDGKITADVMRKAFAEAATDIDARFGKTVPTMGQAMNVLKNNTERFIGQLDKATGVTAGISQALLWLGDNLKGVAYAAAVSGAAMALHYGPALVGMLGKARTAMIAFNVAVLANPLVALGTALVAVALGIAMYGDSIMVAADKSVTLKDVSIGALQVIGDGFVTVGELMKDAWGAGIDYVNSKTNGWGEQFRDVFSALGRLLKANANSFIGTFVGAYNAIKTLWNTFPELMKDVFANVVNFGAAAVEHVVNAWQLGFKMIISGMKSLAPDTAKSMEEALGKMRIEVPRLEVGKGVKTGLAEIGADFKKAFDTDYVGKGMDAVMAKAEQVSKKRRADEADAAAATLRGTGKNNNGPVADPAAEKAAKKAAKELEKLKKSLADVRGEVDPTEGALKRLAQAQEILNKSVAKIDPVTKKSLITQEEANRVMDRLRQKYRDALDPIGAVIRKMEEQTNTYKLLGDAQQDNQKMMEITRELESKNIQLTKESTAAIMEKIAAEREAARMNSARNSVLSETVYSQRDQMDKIQATGDLKKAGDITGGQAANSAMAIFGEDALANTEDGFKAYEQKYQEFLQRIEAARQNDVISQTTAEKLKAQAQAEYQQKNLGTAQTFFGHMAGLASSGNKKLAAIGKAAQIANAIISTYTAANSAYAAMAGIPIVGPALGAAAAGAAIVAGMANVAAIRSQNVAGYEQGGYTGNFGRQEVAGVVHGQEFVMDAETTKRVGRKNLEGLQDGSASIDGGGGVGNNGGTGGTGSAGGGGQAPQPIEIYNVVDPRQIQDIAVRALTSGPGRTAIVNSVFQEMEAKGMMNRRV